MAPTGFRPLPGPYSPADTVGVESLVRCGSAAHACAMFSVDEATAAAVRQVYEASGELSAVVEFRRHFPGITDNAAARRCVRRSPGGSRYLPYPESERIRTRSSTP